MRGRSIDPGRFVMGVFMVIILALTLTAFSVKALNNVSNKHEVEIQVERAFTKRSPSSEKSKEQYLITGKDKDGNVQSFKITDTLLLGKFNSTDIFGSITEGKYYRFVVYGWRIPILSEYPNIKSVEEIDGFSSSENL